MADNLPEEKPVHAKNKPGLPEQDIAEGQEAMLIHAEPFKSHVSQHSEEAPLEDLQIEEFYDSATDFFKEISNFGNGDLPFEARIYETFILRKKEKPPHPDPKK